MSEEETVTRARLFMSENDVTCVWISQYCETMMSSSSRGSSSLPRLVTGSMTEVTSFKRPVIR